MPVDSLCFRASCGTFLWTFLGFMWKRAKNAIIMRTETLKVKFNHRYPAAVFMIVLLVGQLLRCGDIESNPGPAKKQSTLAGTTPTRTASTSSVQAEKVPAGGAQLSLEDIMKAISGMDTKFDTRFDDVSKSLTSLEEQISSVSHELSDLRDRNEHLTQENRKLNEKVDRLEAHLDDMENRSRRQNLIFYGIPKASENETGQQCEDKVKSIIHDKMNVENDIQFDRVHRLKAGAGQNGAPPMIARFTFFKDKERVLKCKQRLKGTDIYVSGDYSKRIRDIRKKQSPHLKKAKAEKKLATLVYDHLVIDGQRYTCNPNNDSLVRMT